MMEASYQHMSEDTIKREFFTEKIRSVNFKIEHIKRVIEDESESIDIDAESVDKLAKSNLSYTILDNNDDIVAIFGVYPDKDKAYSWLFLGNLFRKHARDTTICINYFIDVLSHDGVYKSIVGTVDEGFERGDKWIRNCLGFSPLNRKLIIGESSLILYEREL
jgi:hypothetical protein